MITNEQSLKDKAGNYARMNHIEVQQVLQNYIFERFLERLSKSNYKSSFILKGGFLLSSIMGIDVRSTRDIDANITGINFSKSEISTLIKEVLAIDLNDNTSFIIDDVESIREDNLYGGFRFKLIGKTFNISIPFHIDISCGDVITPNAIEYNYKTILENIDISIYSYNIETILAEKLQTILYRDVINSRMKDYYDIFFLYTYRKNGININHLRQAVKMTFENRKTLNLIPEAKTVIETISKSSIIRERWINYSNTYVYAKDISFDLVVESLKSLCDEVFDFFN